MQWQYLSIRLHWIEASICYICNLIYQSPWRLDEWQPIFINTCMACSPSPTHIFSPPFTQVAECTAKGLFLLTVSYLGHGGHEDTTESGWVDGSLCALARMSRPRYLIRKYLQGLIQFCHHIRGAADIVGWRQILTHRPHLKVTDWLACWNNLVILCLLLIHFN